MKMLRVFILSILAFTPAASSVFAHHSTASIYHEDQVIEIHGVVKEWRFINPHPYLTIEVETEDGTVNEWDVSFGGSAVTHLKRRGYTADTFKAGEVIIFRGNPAKAVGVYGLLVEREDPTRGDGSPLF